MSCCRIVGRQWFRLGSSRRDWCPETFAPGVEGAFFQALFTAIGADRLARPFLLTDSFAPLLAAVRCFRLHVSTMRPLWLLGQRGLCGAYGECFGDAGVGTL
jgi:hypothetical protein